MNLKIIKSDEILNKIIENFDEDIYLVGGSVRDLFFEKISNDRDLIILNSNARDFSLKIAEFFEATFIPLDEENKIYRIVMPDKINYLDITNPIENDLDKDLRRRDLTINAIAINIRTLELVDPTNGVKDLQNGLLRQISEQNFIDDPLRLLRVYRFLAKTGFDIEASTLASVKSHLDLISKPAIERINYEIMHLFDSKYSDKALLAMDEVGLLEKLFSFVCELKKVPPNTHHHLRLLDHCIETVRNIQNIFENSDNLVVEHLNRVDFGGYRRLAHLKLSGVMHDIGKFSTWTIEQETGRHRFIKHDDVGAKLSVPILKSMSFSNKQIDYISKMIKNHIYPSSVISAPDLSEKVMMRYVRKMDLDSIDAIILAKSDRLSARGPAITDEMVENNLLSLDKLLNFYLSVRDTLEPLPKLLDGNEIMKILNIPPSPKLGEIMNALHESQINGDILTKEHAINFVKSFV